MKTSHQGDGRLPMISKIMINLCIGDLLTSFFADFLSTWMAPEDVPGSYPFGSIPFAAGSPESRKAQGFLYMLGLSIAWWSNAALAVAYWVTVSRDGKNLDNVLSKFFYLGFPWIISLITPISFLLVDGQSFYGYEFKGYHFNGLW